MNVFLTGESHVGKSSLINRALATRPDLRLGGFRTLALREPLPGAIGGVYMLDASQTQADCGLANRVGMRWRDRSPEGFPAMFDALGVRLLDPSSADLLPMDELGFLERDARRFQAAVFRALDSQTPVLGALRAQATPFLNAIRARDDVRVFTVTIENRDSLLPRLCEALTI